MRFKQTIMAGVLVALLSGAANAAQAQQMLLSSPRTSGYINDPITFDVFVTGNIGGAVSWGTNVALFDPVHMSYVPNYDGQSNPYRSKEPFFDYDLTDTSQVQTGILKFNFLNLTPGANFGYNGPVTLAEFQVLFSSDTPVNTDFTVGLSPLDIPPTGTGVLDDQSNNLLQPIDPNNPKGPGSTAHLYVTGFGPNLRWNFGFPPQDVPEPSAWLIALSGTLAGTSLLRRRRA